MSQPLIVGDVAPDFEASTKDGKLVHLSRLRGNPVWLIFYRYAGCPICNLHLLALSHREEVLKTINLQVVAVFDSPKDSFPKTLAGKPYPDIPLIPDPQNRLFNLYKTTQSLSGVIHPKVATNFFKAMFSGFKQPKIDGKIGQMPAHFLIDPEGQLDTIYYGKHAADHIPWEKVDDFVERARQVSWKANSYR